MLKSRQYAEILRIFIEKMANELGCEIKYKIYIKLDFSLYVKLFVDLPDSLRVEFPEDEEEEAFQIRFSQYVKNSFMKHSEVILTADEAGERSPFVPEVSFEVENFSESASTFNSRILLGPPIEFGAKYRLSSLIDTPVKREGKTKWGETPIISFYSYKGGMGRTTTLIAYALYLAAKGEKVAVVDCDLEAPGYLNFFNLSNQRDLMKGLRNGLVEYMSDYSFVDGQDNYIDLANYLVIPDPISQGGLERDYVRNIFIVPGGNLNNVSGDVLRDEDEERLQVSGKDYMEGLSRLNISNPFETRDAMGSLFAKLTNDFKVDVILVDSRTGFNDIFGTVALSMSDHVVGFAGFSDQTMPGLRQLFRYYANENASFRLDIITNLIPQDADVSWIERGKDKIYKIWNSESHGCKKETPGHYILRRMSVLERLGTGDEGADASLITLVEDILDDSKRSEVSFEIGDMAMLFEHLTDSAKLNLKTNDTEEIYGSSEDYDASASLNSNISPIRMQKAILNHTKSKLEDVHVFAEDTDIKNSMFFYRKCMAEFFNPKKFIILGSKGSGKSMLYRALGNQEFASTAKFIIECASKTAQKYNFDFEIPNSEEIVCLNTLALKTDFDLNDLFRVLPPDKLKNFWMIYTWNAIMTDSRLTTDSLFQETVVRRSEISSYVVSSDKEDFEKKDIFKELVDRDDFKFLGNVEKDFRFINSYFENQGKSLYILYDGLDNINPRTWSKNISPLVNFWRDRTDKYSNIMPKLFIRTDLFAYIEGTNTLRLKETSINIDWSLEEVFGYFFKIVLSDESIKQLFWKILEKLDKGIHAKTIQNSWDDEAGQLLFPHPGLLVPLVNIYFGKKVPDAQNIDSWNFFKNSLSNASGGISLRPFINLLKNDKDILGAALQDPDRHVLAILPSKYYATQENRDLAANGNFMDMAKGGDFTADILLFKEYLTQSSKGKRFRYKELDEYEFEKLLTEIIKEYGDRLISRTKIELQDQLIAAGIVAEIPRRVKYYIFARMYHYTWGLQNAENWERGMLSYGRRNNMVVITQDGKRISFRPYNEPKNAQVGDKIEYKLVEDYPGSFKVDQWRFPYRK